LALVTICIWVYTFWGVGACDQPEPQSSYLCLPHTWDYSLVSPHLAYLLRWRFSKFLPGLASNCSLPYLCLLSSHDHAILKWLSKDIWK
jgi:hypothetical protein